MAIIGTVIGVLAFIATAWGVYYARGQLREAKKTNFACKINYSSTIR
jgi:hypothetical protein